MKKRILLSTLIISALSLNAVPATFHKPHSSPITNEAISSSAVSLDEVAAYMAEFGITIITIKPIDGSENVYAWDNFGKRYIIYVSQGVIIGWDNANQ